MSVRKAVSSESADRFLIQRRFARECALQYLYQCDIQKDWSCEPGSVESFRQQTLELDSCLPEKQLADAWEFAERLIHGVVAQIAELDARIRDCALNWTLERMSAIDRNILRLAAFELNHCDDIPDVATIDEAIELAKEFGHKDSGRFVNGILDNMLRQRRSAALNDT